MEIEAAKIAQQKGNANEKQFAQQMNTDHTKTSSELNGMVPANMKAGPPTALDDSSQKKLGNLHGTKPEDFAGQYDPMQVSAHKDAASLFEAMRRSCWRERHGSRPSTMRGHNFIADVADGDLWDFPSGIPHSIQGLPDDRCEFLLAFPDGNFSEDCSQR